MCFCFSISSKLLAGTDILDVPHLTFLHLLWAVPRKFYRPCPGPLTRYDNNSWNSDILEILKNHHLLYNLTASQKSIRLGQVLSTPIHFPKSQIGKGKRSHNALHCRLVHFIFLEENMLRNMFPIFVDRKHLLSAKFLLVAAQNIFTHHLYQIKRGLKFSRTLR